MNFAHVLLLLAGAFAALLLASAKIVGEVVPPGQIIFSLGIYSFLPSLIYFGLKGDIPFRLYLNAPLLQSSMGLGVVAAFWLLLMVLNTHSLLFAALLVFMLSAMQLASRYWHRRESRQAEGRFGIDMIICGVAMFALPLLIKLPVATANLMAILVIAWCGALLALRQSKVWRSQWKLVWPSALGFYSSILAVIVGAFSTSQGWVDPNTAESFHLIWIGVLFGLMQIAIIHAKRLEGLKRPNFNFETGFLLMVTFLEIAYFRERPANNILFALPFFLTALIFMAGQKRAPKGER